MSRKDELDFDLSKIVQELSSKVPPAPLASKPPADPLDDADLEELMRPYLEEANWKMPEEPKTRFAEPEPEPEEAKVQTTSDTIRLDAIQQAVVSASATEAVKIDEEVDLQSTMAFQPLGDEEPDEQEAFEQEWDPDFSDADEDFHIAEPILRRPKSRLRELRQKLVNGPEQRYYALSEQGVGKLLATLICNALLMLLSIGFTLLCTMKGLPADRLRLVVFVQFLTMLLSALLGCYRMIDGVMDTINLRFTPNSLLALTFLVCCVDGVICLQQLRLSVCGAFSVQMTMALWAAYNRHNTEMGQMDTLRRASNLDGLACVPDDYEDMTGFRICRGEVEHFMDNYQEVSAPDRMLNWYCLSVAAASLVIGVIGGLFHGFSVGIQVCCASLMVGLPATGFLATVRPMEVLEKRLHKLGTVICGWQGVQAVRRRIAVPLDDKDLFPAGSVKLNGVKFYGDFEPDQVVSYTSALIGANGGALVELFEQLRDSRGGRMHLVENLHIYKGGVGGEIGEDGVLVGTLQFMQDMGVEIGKGTRVSQAVYTAIEGELCGVFAVTYGKAKTSVAGVRTLCACRSLTPVMTTKDFMITESFIRSKFLVNTRRIAFPDRSIAEDICARKEPEDPQMVALTTRTGLAPMAYAITGARTLGSAMYTGVFLHMIGGIVGLLIMAALAYIGAAELLSPLYVILYQLVWMVPGFLITEWTRTI